MPALSDFFSIRRRYSRSVNLERDMELPDAVAGYFLTSRAIDALERFYRAYSTPKSVRAWTITGPYGTGKSAFAHFLSALSASADDHVRKNAVQALEQIDKTGSLKKLVLGSLADAGLIRAAVTAQREPIANTILRALEQGSSIFWRRTRGPRPKVLSEIADLRAQASAGKRADSQAIIEAIRNLAKASRTGILLIIDELGKNLEFSSQNQSLDDLFLLQQIAELPSGEQEPKIFLFGLLHQSFVDYAHGLTTAQRNEWAKIQGRFEDIPFAESSERVLRLIGHAIERKKNDVLSAAVSVWAEKWTAFLKKYEFSNAIDQNAILAIYPLHPLSALVLPILCNKFSQNDRTLFTFLASAEPNPFSFSLLP